MCNGQDPFDVDLTQVPNYFVKFGPDHGDLTITANDDGSSGSFPISTAFPFFDHLHNFLFVSTNGVISFLQAVSTYTPHSFPLGSDRRLIAAFWGDVDTRRNGGRIYYRQESYDFFEDMRRGLSVYDRSSSIAFFLVTLMHTADFFVKSGSSVQS